MATYPNVNAANQYARDIVGGKILACQLTILACQRHLDDLERAKDPHWPYRFDKNKAERFLRFAQKMPHTSGEWARRKLRIEFEAWQKFALGVPFGWVHKKTGLRRFSEIYIEVPRKNGKSAIAAAVGNYMFCADGEHGAEVYCGATTEKQAWKVFSPALQMVKKLPALRQKFSIKPWAKKMTRPDGSVFAPVIGDPGDGDSPSCAIIDEYHEHTTDALYTTMTTGMGAREQPMTLIITTVVFGVPHYVTRQTMDSVKAVLIPRIQGITEDAAIQMALNPGKSPAAEQVQPTGGVSPVTTGRAEHARWSGSPPVAPPATVPLAIHCISTIWSSRMLPMRKRHRMPLTRRRAP